MNSSIPRKEEEANVFYFKAPIPFSHLWGAISGFVTSYITNPFPEGYIKTIWNAKQEPFEQRSASFRDVFMKPMPTLFINPKFDPMEETKFRPINEFDAEVANLPYDDERWSNNNSHAVILARDSRFVLYYRPRRYKLEYDMTFGFRSEAERIQAQMYLRQEIRHRVPTITHQYIEKSIPTGYIEAIADLYGMDCRSSEFEDKLNTISQFPIKYRLRTGSGNYEWFMNEYTIFDIETNMTTNGPARRGNLVVESSFNENVVVEFTAPGSYMLNIKANKKPEIKDEVDNSDAMSIVATNFYLTRKANPTFEGDFIKYKEIDIQADKSGDDTISLFDQFENMEFAKTLQYIREQNLNIRLVNIKVIENLNMLPDNRIEFNQDTCELTIKDMDVYKRYTIAIYINNKAMNEIKDDLFRLTDKER